MIRFHYSLAPNPMKVALLLEELGLEYEAIPVDTRKGEQHAAAFTALNPNAKVPVIEDGGTVVFDSNAILLFLADRAGRFTADIADPARATMLSWLMFVATGIGPYSGQYVHFRHYAPEPKDYAVSRYLFEARRHWRIVDERLAGQRFLAGGDYTIADMALWGWSRSLKFMLGEEAETFVNVRRLVGEIEARPAAIRAMALKDRHAFKTETDAEARRHMFRHAAVSA